MERQNNCVLCNRSVLRCRNYILTEQFLEGHRDHIALLLQEIIPREVSYHVLNILCSISSVEVINYSDSK